MTELQQQTRRRQGRGGFFSTLLARLLAVVVFFSLLARLDFVGIHGAGTGKNKAHLTPLEGFLFFTVREVRLRGGTSQAGRVAQQVSSALLTPGEASKVASSNKWVKSSFNKILSGKMPSFSAKKDSEELEALKRDLSLVGEVARVRAKELEKDVNYSKIFKDQPILAPVCVVSFFVAYLALLVAPRQASIMLFFSSVAFFLLVQQAFGKTATLETPAIATLVATMALSFLNE